MAGSKVEHPVFQAAPNSPYNDACPAKHGLTILTATDDGRGSMGEDPDPATDDELGARPRHSVCPKLTVELGVAAAIAKKLAKEAAS